MDERQKNIEALKILPFTDIVLPEAEAVDLLSQNFRRVVTGNLDIMIPKIQPETPNYESAVAYYKRFRQEVSGMQRGGIGLSADAVAQVYSDHKGKSFMDLMDRIVGVEIPNFLRGPYEDNKAQPSISMILDSLKLIDPKIATFDDGVAVFVESMRRTGYVLRPFQLGAMVDDVVKKCGTANILFDWYSDSEGAAMLGTTYSASCNEAERVDFQNGLDITLNELQMLVSGRSAN